MTIARPLSRDAVCALTWGEMLRRLSPYDWRVGYSQDVGRYWCMLIDESVLADAMCWGDTIGEAVIGALTEVGK